MITIYMIFPKRGGGGFIGKMKEWEASISVLCYTSASRPFKEVARYANASSILIHHVICLVSIFRLFLISGPIFVQLFGGLSELLYLWISYSRKAIDVKFPMVLASFNLELRLSIYHARKGGDAKLKNSERLPFKNSYLLIQNWCHRALLVKIS